MFSIDLHTKTNPQAKPKSPSDRDLDIEIMELLQKMTPEQLIRAYEIACAVLTMGSTSETAEKKETDQ